MIKAFLIRKLSVTSIRELRKVVEDVRAFGLGKNLERLGRIYGTDKSVVHYYTQHYQTHFKKFKFKKINLLEIGVGGYDKPHIGGNSLRMWRKYFPFGRIYSLDLYDKTTLKENRIKIFTGSQVDEAFLNKVTQEIGDIDIIIDDGSHMNEHVIESFKVLFPKLMEGGIYAIEDTQTSYWKDFGGDSENLDNPSTMMNYFKSLTDSLNNKEFIKPGYQQNYFDKTIVSMHFYHNLIFIYKGKNDEGSNLVLNNQFRKRINDKQYGI
ncbi:MAG: class I SAM-dependent methyltransferase [Saprospiraceae bacterium]